MSKTSTTGNLLSVSTTPDQCSNIRLPTSLTEHVLIREKSVSKWKLLHNSVFFGIFFLFFLSFICRPRSFYRGGGCCDHFVHLLPASLTPEAPWMVNIFANFREKNWNGVYRIGFAGSNRNGFRSHLSPFRMKTKMIGVPSGAPISGVLSKTVFAYIFPVSNENEMEQRIPV